MRRRSESEERDAPLRSCEIGGALRAERNMRAEIFALVTVNDTEREKVEIFGANWMLNVQVSSRFKASIAMRIHVFTVPSGAPVRPAISLCDIPSK